MSQEIDFPKTRKAIERYDREVARGPTGYIVFPWSPPDAQQKSWLAYCRALRVNVCDTYLQELGENGVPREQALRLTVDYVRDQINAPRSQCDSQK